MWVYGFDCDPRQCPIREGYKIKTLQVKIAQPMGPTRINWYVFSTILISAQSAFWSVKGDFSLNVDNPKGCPPVPAQLPPWWHARKHDRLTKCHWPPRVHDAKTQKETKSFPHQAARWTIISYHEFSLNFSINYCRPVLIIGSQISGIKIIGYKVKRHNRRLQHRQ